MKNIVMPYVMHRDIKNDPRSKAIKIKILEAPLVDSRLWLASGFWNDAAIQQFIRFDGIKKSGATNGSKDDIPDSIATAYQVWGPRAMSEPQDPEEAEQKRRQDEEEGARERRRHFYDRMFGGEVYTPPPPKSQEPVAEQKPRDPRLAVFGSKGPWRL